MIQRMVKMIKKIKMMKIKTALAPSLRRTATGLVALSLSVSLMASGCSQVPLPAETTTGALIETTAPSQHPKEGSPAETAQAQPSEHSEIVYSNLVGTEAQAHIRMLMEDAKLSNIDFFFETVDAFNAPQLEAVHLASALTPALSSQVRAYDGYDSGALVETYPESFPYTADTNCRLTVFTLMQDSVVVPGMADYGSYLMFDVDALETDPGFAPLLPKKDAFIGLFNEVAVEGVADAELEAHYLTAMTDRKIVYTNTRASIITVVMHDPDFSILFTGHTGVLLQDDAGFWFLEKLAQNHPYKLTRFPSKTALKAALQARYVTEDGAHTPMIFENGIPIE